MIKALLLDADGVVITGISFSKRLEMDYGITTDITAEFFQGVFQKCLVGKADLKKELPIYLKRWKIPMTVDKFTDYWFRSEHKLNQELLDYITLLRKKGLRYYVTTNQEKYRTEYILHEMEFCKLFDGVFSSAYISYKKPQQKYFEKVLENLKNIKKDEIIFFDSSKENVEAAKLFGIKSKLYKDLEDFKKKMNNN